MRNDYGVSGRIDGLGVGFDDDDHNGGLTIELRPFKPMRLFDEYEG